MCLAVEFLPDNLLFMWAKTPEGASLFLFTPQLSRTEFVRCLKDGPNDSSFCLNDFYFTGLEQVYDWGIIYAMAADLSCHWNVPCPQVFCSNHISLAGVTICNNDGIALCIILRSDLHPDRQAESLVHEMRHIWQYNTNQEKYFSNYRPFSELSGAYEEKYTEYMKQEAELDAEAFAWAFLHHEYKTPLNWDTHTDEINQIIEMRAREYLERPDEYALPLSA